MDNQIVRPALGQVVKIGSYYDVRHDIFLNQSILAGSPEPGVISQHDRSSVDTRVSYGESFAADHKAANVGLDLGVSLLSGLLSSTLHTQHLVEMPQNEVRTLKGLIHHNFTSGSEKLELMNPGLPRCLSSAQSRTSVATHVVAEVEYGVQSTLAVERWLKQDSKKENERQKFQQQVSSLLDAIEGRPHASLPEFDHITARTNMLNNDGTIVLIETQECLKFLELIPSHIRVAHSKANPIAYKLLPIQTLSLFNLVSVDTDMPLYMPGQDCSKKFIQLCDDFRNAEQLLSEYITFATQYKFCLPTGHVNEITHRIGQTQSAAKDLRSSFARTLQDVRSGRADSDLLWQLIKEYSDGSRSPGALSRFEQDFQGKVAFIGSMMAQGATYIGYNSPSLSSQLQKRGNVESYVFYYSEEAKKDEESWSGNQNLMMSLLGDYGPGAFFAIVDCDATRVPMTLEKARISKFESGVEVVPDLFDEQQYMAENCFARYSPPSIQKDKTQRPTKRCLVKIPCPGRECSAGDICEWHCSVCHAPFEFGYDDQYIYCECGRSFYSNFDFKCNGNSHGPGFDRYNDNRLLGFLKSLDQSDYLNVLILGESGVGKSTFINAFVNYLYFKTLDEALAADGLQSVIPCSFSLVRQKDPASEDGELETIRIQVGERESEKDGSMGQSATQQTQVYPITVGASTYRLIDTPGIGDTRGLAFDKSNMADILATVSSYDHLHGILILLKSNVTRLTPHFSFCVKQLLTHLHRNATENVVFGFTNTRNSNYTPGDTLGPLQSLLKGDQDMGLTLTRKTTYCFDSESFRYLAAYKQNCEIENKPDFVNSWRRSSDEAERMLAYFRTKDPHPVKSTMGLNGTRTLITQLTKPMAEISKQINANVATMEDDVRALRDTRLTGDKLRQKLRPEITLLRRKPLDKPRTVCKGQGCMEQKDDGQGIGTMETDYPSPCHAPCFLNNVPIDVTAHPDMQHCAAFGGQMECKRCSHHWTMHMHILYELETYKARITDTTIEQQIKQHASDVVMKETAINNRKALMAEMRAEHEKIGDAAAKFGLWMKANSILPYNDATLAYLDVLITNEQAKVDAGGLTNKKVLADLEEDKRKHEELVAVLTASMKSSGKTQPITQAEVDRIVQSLYNLKHFGQSLRSLQIGITQAHAMTNRELPHRINHRQMGRGNHSRSASLHYGVRTGHGNGSRQSHPQSPAPNRLQRPMSRQPGFDTGTIRPNSISSPIVIQPLPGSFIAEIPNQKPLPGFFSTELANGKAVGGQSSMLERAGSKLKKGSGWNIFNLR